MTAARKKLRIGVLFGGRSGEHEVSLASATSVLDYLDTQKYEVIPIGITQAGKWLAGITPAELRTITKSSASVMVDKACRVSPLDSCLIAGEALATIESHLDVIFPVLHGTYGEDGTVQGLLELLNKPYVGCGVLGSALGMDKEMMKWVLRARGISTVEHLTYHSGCQESSSAALAQSVERNLGYPCFVKPANGGSSIGVSKVYNRKELNRAFQLAAEYDSKVIVEQAIDARELSCAVIGNNAPLASVVGEVLVQRDFYDYTAKYLDGSTQTVVPAPIPRSVALKLRNQAVQAFLALDLSGMARVDFFLERKTNRLFINEVNTWPSFTHVCMYPRLCAESGLHYPLLLDRLIELALERHADRQSKRMGLFREPHIARISDMCGL